MYLEPSDAEIILDWLNNDDEIAFFVSKGPKKWKAVKTIDKLKTYNLFWHTPYQNLPLIRGNNEKPGVIENPWLGWEEVRNSRDDIPYFNDCPGTIKFNLLINRFYIDENNKPVDAILISSFGWIGNYYKVLGKPALEETEKWWKNLRKRINKFSQKIVLTWENNRKTDIYAFPNALKAIENGKRALNQPYTESPKKTYEK
jgi:hypothetical protein